MKYVLIVIALSLLGCKKEDSKHCYQCTNLIINQPNADTINKSTGVQCDKTQKDIDDFVKANTFTQKDPYGHMQYFTETCTMQ